MSLKLLSEIFEADEPYKKLSYDEFVGKGDHVWHVNYDHGRWKGKNTSVQTKGKSEDEVRSHRAFKSKKGVKINSITYKGIRESLDEAVKSGNAQWGFYGTTHRVTQNHTTTSKAFQKMHATVRKATSCSDHHMVTHYLDSARGRHLATRLGKGEIGAEGALHAYLQKDFKSFEKTYDPKHFGMVIPKAK